MKKILILCSLLCCLSFIKPKEVDTVVRDDPDKSWVDSLIKNQIGYTFPIIKKVKTTYPSPNIVGAYVFMWYGDRGMRYLDMYVAVYEPQPIQMAVMFRVEMTAYPYGGNPYQRYIQLLMAPGSQDKHFLAYTGYYWTMSGDWEVWSYCEYTCG